MDEALQNLFERGQTGDESAIVELTPALYNELHRLAAHHMRGERAGHTLQPTALVHEAYLKLFDDDRKFADAVHFVAVASRVMRQVLVDHARRRAALKRSSIPAEGDSGSTSLEVRTGKDVELLDLIALDTAIQELAVEHEKMARLVEMRYFGGMTAEESAEALGESVHKVRHDLRYAQAWLRRKLSDKREDSASA